MDNIAEAALDPNTAEKTLRPALEIIGFAVKLGLAHPKDLLPVLVALETSDTRNVADKAFALHDKLHNSFTSVIMDGMAATVRKVFDFQARLKGFERLSGTFALPALQATLISRRGIGYSGDPPSALLNRWYSFMRDKRAWRNDFLRILTREYHVEAGLEKNFSQVSLYLSTACQCLTNPPNDIFREICSTYDSLWKILHLSIIKRKKRSSRSYARQRRLFRLPAFKL